MNKTLAIITLICLSFPHAELFAKKKSRREKTPVELVSNTPEKKVTKDEPAKPFVLTNLDSELSGEWTIKTLKGRSVATAERAFLNFDTKENRIYGSNGCNIINGDFSSSGNQFKFDNIITTTKECIYSNASKNILKALAEVSSITIIEREGIEYLQLLDKSNKELMELKRHNFDFINGAWTVTEIAGTEINTGKVRIVIDTDQMKLHGNTGCNIINGEISIDSDKYHAIQFENIISTRKMCEDIATETALLIALEQTVSARKESNNTVVLIDKKGDTVAILSHLSLNK